MQLVPGELNDLLQHIGSASIARRIASQNPGLARNMATEVNQLAINDKGPLAKVAKRFKSVLGKGLKKVGKALPIIGGVLVILDFAENVEAHGVGGAVLRSTPVLGDLVSLYDVASDLAIEIESRASESIKEYSETVNENSRKAHREAAALTVQEFERISGNVRVTNPYFRCPVIKKFATAAASIVRI